MSRRLRLILIVCGSVALATLLALVIVVYLLLQPDRFTAMLQTQARNVGLELQLAEPASPSLFPRPALDLRGITLHAQRATAPILLAARGRLALPWRTLLGGPTVISQLQLEAPRVDLGALQAWLDGLPPGNPDKVPNIPRIDTGVSISRGSIVRGDELLLSNVDLQAGPLVSGQPFPVHMSARTPSGMPLILHVASTPRIEGGTLELDHIALHLEQTGNLVLTLNGSARWHGTSQTTASLAGKLEHTNVGQYDISVQLTPPSAQQPSLLALKLDGPGDHADLRLPPQELLAWWGQLIGEQAAQLTLPPGSADIKIDTLQAGGISIKGLSVVTSDDAPVAASSTSPARAGTSSAARKAPAQSKR
ncbi:MAG: AsmA family protein [Rhodanobacter sp.]